MSYASVATTIELFNFVAGIILCAPLLFCLCFRTRQNIGTYRHLQITMVIIDTSYTCVQMFIKERMVSAPGIFAMMPTSSFGVTQEILVGYLALYNLTFVMIDYGFLYRLWAIKSPRRVSLFSSSQFIVLLVLVAILESSLWFVTVYVGLDPTDSGRQNIRDATFQEFGLDSTSQVMIMGDYFMENGSLNPRIIYAVGVLCFIMGVCFGFMIYAFTDIFRHLENNFFVSKNTIRLQRQLFCTLCLQTLVPLICLYSPCAVTIIFPLLRLDSSWMAVATPILVSFFLPLDALAVILSTSDYRREISQILRCKITQSSVCVENIRDSRTGKY